MVFVVSGEEQTAFTDFCKSSGLFSRQINGIVFLQVNVTGKANKRT